MLAAAKPRPDPQTSNGLPKARCGKKLITDIKLNFGDVIFAAV